LTGVSGFVGCCGLVGSCGPLFHPAPNFSSNLFNVWGHGIQSVFNHTSPEIVSPLPLYVMLFLILISIFHLSFRHHIIYFLAKFVLP
jgi:hypothetical protein